MDDDSQEARQQRVWQVVSQIPPGSVATYGQVAELAGLGNGARQVGKILGALPKNSRLPWFRVINSQGRISLPDGPRYERQRERLAADGIVLVNGRVNLRLYRWQP
jgi:methylated-DNA-protein-cysteine methyltransferase-like protein